MSKSVTFEVSRVERATEPIPELPYKQAIDRLLAGPLQRRKESLVERAALLRRLPPAFAREEHRRHTEQALAEVEGLEAGLRPTEACSRYHGRLVVGSGAHPFLAAIHNAFMDHRPLCLSPDMVWLLLCQGAANHVNAHAEQLRPRFVRHQGKAQIVIRRDDFVKGSPENPWAEVIDAFAAQVAEHVGPTHDLFLPRFSTTGPTERAAALVVLLDAMQSYFDYVLMTLCGIPAITLEGTAEDWQVLAERAGGFAPLGLEWWLEPLAPILGQFAAAARGQVDVGFWQSLYRYNSYSGGASVTGWVAGLFPYLKDDSGRATVPNRWLREGGEGLERLLAGAEERGFGQDGPALGNFPSGLARAPFRWEFLHQACDMELLGGFVGVSQDAQTLSLRPEIGWAVRETGR